MHTLIKEPSHFLSPAEIARLEAASAHYDRRTELNRCVDPAAGVLLYALTTPERSPEQDLAAAAEFAHARGWPVTEDYSDNTHHVDPGLRYGWAQTLTHLADTDSKSAGVIVASQAAISVHAAVYESVLEFFKEQRYGLWLVRPETVL